MKDTDLRLGIFASGGGSTGEVLFNRAAVVICNNSPRKAGVYDRVERYNQQTGSDLKCLWIPRAPHRVYGPDGEVLQSESLLKYGEALLPVLKDHGVNFISLNGSSVPLPPNVVEEYEGRAANSHPAPLRYKRLGFGGRGLHGRAAHAAVLTFAQSIDRPFTTEVTEHLVTNEYDTGPEVAFTEVPIDKEKHTPDTLQDDVKASEIIQLDTFWNQVLKRGSDRIPRLPRRPALILPHECKKWAVAIASGIALYPEG